MLNVASCEEMHAAVRRFHVRHDFAGKGDEDLAWRVALMAEEPGEISSSVTKGKPVDLLTDECAGLLILLPGTGLAADVNWRDAFRNRIGKLATREARMIKRRIGVSGFCDNWWTANRCD